MLLVEDDAILRRLVAESLDRRGYAVFVASSGQEALKLIQSAPHGLFGNLVTDIRMPGMDGIDLIWNFLKGGVIFQKIVVTSLWIEEEQERLQKLVQQLAELRGPILKLIQKPYGPRDIFAVLEPIAP